MSIYPKPTANNQPSTTSLTERLIAYWIRNQKTIAICVTLSLAILLAVLAWYRYQAEQDKTAQQEMYQATYEFEADNYEKALNGEEGYIGFLDILKNYRFTKAANLANLYVGIIYMQQTKYSDAIPYLKQFKATDYLLQARAWSLLGDAYSQLQDYSQASTYYLKAADYRPNEFFTPIYLTKAATVYEAQGNHQAARQCYERIMQAYPKSTWYEEASKHSSRLAGLN